MWDKVCRFFEGRKHFYRSSELVSHFDFWIKVVFVHTFIRIKREYSGINCVLWKPITTKFELKISRNGEFVTVSKSTLRIYIRNDRFFLQKQFFFNIFPFFKVENFDLNRVFLSKFYQKWNIQVFLTTKTLENLWIIRKFRENKKCWQKLHCRR